MFELDARGGLGRSGRWARSGREVRTPAVLSVHRPGRPAPPYADVLLVAERTPDPRLQIRVGGSRFAPRDPSDPDDLPPTNGVPLGLEDLEVPRAPPAGDLAIVASEADLEGARGAEAVFLANGPQFLRRPRAFARTMARVRETLGPAKLVAATGIATPANLAVLVYAGVDLLDTSRVLLDSALGVFHTSDGALPAAEADPSGCACPACEAGEGLAAHNERALHRELLVTRTHLARGRLRELAERRLANDPWNTAVLRHLDLRHGDLLEAYAPVAGAALLAYSHASLTRPEVVRFRRRVRARYARPPSARVLLLLPCSARKPYSASRSHRRFREAVRASGNPAAVHEVVVTSPLGLIPRELERFYPARAYDIPVTGDWNREEAAIVTEDLRAFLAANPYDAVVAHLGAEAPIVREVLPDATFPADDRPTSEPSLAALAGALADAVAAAPKVPGARRFAEEIGNIARFQFGDPGRGLVEGATFKGRFPGVRVLRDGVQVAMHTSRGQLSLTLAGGSILSSADAYWVEIEDFVPKGNVFAVGVTDAAPEVRSGDEVVVRHRGEVRAVGTARMNGREMIDAQRGEAVHVRHVVPGKP